MQFSPDTAHLLGIQCTFGQLGRSTNSCGMAVDNLRSEINMLIALYHRHFWDKKVRIAVLALATFVALC
jgi:hypothetical protein